MSLLFMPFHLFFFYFLLIMFSSLVIPYFIIVSLLKILQIHYYNIHIYF